jgi:hypothetical protein
VTHSSSPARAASPAELILNFGYGTNPKRKPYEILHTPVIANKRVKIEKQENIGKMSSRDDY